jgi:hypothetical protein
MVEQVPAPGEWPFAVELEGRGMLFNLSSFKMASEEYKALLDAGEVLYFQLVQRKGLPLSPLERLAQWRQQVDMGVLDWKGLLALGTLEQTVRFVCANTYESNPLARLFRQPDYTVHIRRVHPQYEAPADAVVPSLGDNAYVQLFYKQLTEISKTMYIVALRRDSICKLIVMLPKEAATALCKGLHVGQFEYVAKNCRTGEVVSCYLADELEPNVLNNRREVLLSTSMHTRWAYNTSYCTCRCYDQGHTYSSSQPRWTGTNTTSRISPDLLDSLVQVCISLGKSPEQQLARMIELKKFELSKA